MKAHNIPPCYRKIKEILIMPPDLALLSILIVSNYPCLELIFMVPKVFEPLKFDCNNYRRITHKKPPYLELQTVKHLAINQGPVFQTNNLVS